MKLKKSNILIGIGTLTLIIIVLYVGNYLNRVYHYKKMAQNIVLTNVDTSELEDGSYLGEYDIDFISARVKVTIQNGQIRQIKLLEHKNERGKTAEKIIGTVIKEQTLEVDAISGATNSSKVILKAIEQALDKSKTN